MMLMPIFEILVDTCGDCEAYKALMHHEYNHWQWKLKLKDCAQISIGSTCMYADVCTGLHFCTVYKFMVFQMFGELMSELMGNSISYTTIWLSHTYRANCMLYSYIYKPNNSKLWLGLLFVSNIIIPLTQRSLQLA
jgi:hypothetical protein